jgi:hypothetical protein
MAYIQVKEYFTASHILIRQIFNNKLLPIYEYEVNFDKLLNQLDSWLNKLATTHPVAICPFFSFPYRQIIHDFSQQIARSQWK